MGLHVQSNDVSSAQVLFLCTSNPIQVMGDGKVLEYDSPLALLENKKSEFYAMVEKMGAEASRRLHQMAKEADREKKLIQN